MKLLLSFLLSTCSLFLQAQDVPFEHQKSIYFPHPMNRNFQASIGFTATTMPYAITEEVHFRIPAADLHAIKRMGKHWYADGRLHFQLLQNMVTLGPRWAKELSSRVSFAAGTDVGFWFGWIKTEGINTRGSGWQIFPNVATGYRFNKRILLTLKVEAIVNAGIRTYAGNTQVATNYNAFGGSAYTIALEQPFYKQKSLTLGFRAIYSNFFWQTWTLFESYDRNLFFPQIIVGLIL